LFRLKNRNFKLFSFNNFFILSFILIACTFPNNNQGNNLVIYSGRSESIVDEIIKDFSEKTGIQVDVRYANSTELANTIILEGNNSPADLFFSQDPINLEKVAEQNLFTQLPIEIMQSSLNSNFQINNYWIPTSLRVRTLGYNSTSTQQEELPIDLYELINSKNKNKIGLAPTNSSFITMVSCMIYFDGEEKTNTWLENIHDQGYIEYPNNSTQINALDNDEIKFGLVNHYYTLRYKSENQTSNVKNYYFKSGCGSLVMPSGIGILKTSKNKENASMFIEFLLTSNTQELITNKLFEFPVIDIVNQNNQLPEINSFQNLEPNQWLELSKLQTKAVELISKAGY
jgi:iron(III) transport system substrate-binding protein